MLPPSPPKPHYPSPQGRPTRLDCARQILLRCTLVGRKVVPSGVPAEVPTVVSIGVPAGVLAGVPAGVLVGVPPWGGAGVPAAGLPQGSAH